MGSLDHADLLAPDPCCGRTLILNRLGRYMASALLYEGLRAVRLDPALPI
jgi:hypothetical protein